MFQSLSKLLSGVILLIPLTSAADIIHWEVQSEADAPHYMGRDFLLTGSFDFNLDTGVFSNITVQTSTTDGCVACNDFSNGGTGATYSWGSFGGVEFSESYGPDASSPGRSYWLQISGADFNVSTPGTYTNLDMTHWGHVLLWDPYGIDPDMYENIGCPECVTAIGSLVPAPEPETYAMMLAGLGILGWQARRRSVTQVKRSSKAQPGV